MLLSRAAPVRDADRSGGKWRGQPRDRSTERLPGRLYPARTFVVVRAESGPDARGYVGAAREFAKSLVYG
jgi:hypothetical protein